MPLDNKSFNYVRELVLERSGIALDESKGYLVETRLAPVARSYECNSIGELVNQMKGKVYGRLHRATVEAMTTNETSFFRDIHPFESLRRDILPELVQKRSDSRTLNIWCAASSSGQEPYTLAMVVRQHFPQLANWKIKILATDISEEMIERARAGIYSQLEVNRGLPAQLLVRYFLKDGLAWRIKDEIRETVEFRVLNLTKPFPPLPAMDLVFIRNVLIYFPIKTKRQVLGEIAKTLQPDGYLFLGGAETTINIDESYKRSSFGKTVCYQHPRSIDAGALAT